MKTVVNLGDSVVGRHACIGKRDRDLMVQRSRSGSSNTADFRDVCIDCIDALADKAKVGEAPVVSESAVQRGGDRRVGYTELAGGTTGIESRQIIKAQRVSILLVIVVCDIEGIGLAVYQGHLAGSLVDEDMRDDLSLEIIRFIRIENIVVPLCR